MKDDLITYKKTLEESKGEKNQYFIVPVNDIQRTSLIPSLKSQKQLMKSFKKPIDLPKDDTDLVKIGEQCEDLMKGTIKYFVDKNIPLNHIELYSDLYVLVDTRIIERLNQINEEEANWNNYSRLFGAYISLSHVYVDISVSDRSGLWTFDKNIKETPETILFDKINVYEDREWEKLRSIRIKGIINLEKFKRHMEEKGYNISIDDMIQNEISIDDYIKSITNLKYGSNFLDISANLNKRGKIRKRL